MFECVLCNDLFQNVKKEYESRDKERTIQRGELDFINLLKDTQKKLVAGKRVEGKVVNILLLSGITNILCQREIVDETTVKVENLTLKTRLELMANWA